MSIIFRQSSCVIEYSEDNGTTWSLVADLNQCFAAQIVGVPGEALRCSIASYVADALETMQNTIIEGESQDVDNGTLAASVLTLLGALGAATTAGLSAVIAGAAVYVATAIQNILIGNYSNALTAAFYDYAKCQLYCLLPDDGDVTAVTLHAWADRIRAYTGSDAAVMNTVADYIVQLPLETWRSLAAVAAAAQVEGDCSQCECVPDCQLIADSTNGTPDPVQDPNDSTLWTLSSTSTPNEDGHYVVRYHLAYPKSCCRFETSASGGFAYPTSAPFAGFRSCNVSEGYDEEFDYQTSPTNVDLYTVGQDTQPCFNAFYIRMSDAFTLPVRVTACEGEDEWCCEFDFTQDEWGFVAQAPANNPSVPHGTWSSAWLPIVDSFNSTKELVIVRSISPAQVTKISIDYDLQSDGNNNHNFTRFITSLEGATQQDIIHEQVINTTVTDATDDALFDGRIVDSIAIAIRCGAFSPYGDGVLYHATVHGVGENPFGEDNC